MAERGPVRQRGQGRSYSTMLAKKLTTGQRVRLSGKGDQVYVVVVGPSHRGNYAVYPEGSDPKSAMLSVAMPQVSTRLAGTIDVDAAIVEQWRTAWRLDRA